MKKALSVPMSGTDIDGSGSGSGGVVCLSGDGKVAGLCLQSGTRLRLQHLSGATGLIATYLIEIGVQIFLTLHCWRSLGLVLVWDWRWFLIFSSLVTSLLVTTMSMVWVCRGLDFVGRAFARLLCYVMHFTLLGLLWRYLKLAFAYDPADVQEFVALRVFQVYIQSLPLTSIHLAFLITFPQEMFGRAFWVILAEIVSVMIALTLSTYIKSENGPKNYQNLHSKTTQIFSDNLKCSVNSDRTVNWSQVLNIELNMLSRLMLLLCRLLVLGILIAHLKLWAILPILLHFVITFAWIGRREEKMAPATADEEIGSEVALEGSYSAQEFLLYVSKCSYIFFWDVTSTLQGSMRISTWIFPAILVILENGGLLVYVYDSDSVEMIIVLTCTGCLILGIILFLVLNFVNCEVAKSIVNDKTDGATMVIPSPAPEIYEDCWRDEKIVAMTMTNGGRGRRGSWDLNLTSLGALEKGKPLIMANNYTNISEVLTRAARVNVNATNMNSEKGLKKLGGDLTTTWVPDTCCNDSNGSSNSRNTNTLSLLEPKDVADENENEADDMVLDNPPFVFYFPEHRTLRHHSVVRKLSLQSEKAGGSRGKSRSPVTSDVVVRTSTPVQIKEAARVIVNYPKHNHYHPSAAAKAASNRPGSRCHCHKRISAPVPEVIDPFYEKLMEDPYGILICEGDQVSGGTLPSRRPPPSNSNYYYNSRPFLPTLSQKLKVLCAKCLQNHDPLLTNCSEDVVEHVIPSRLDPRVHTAPSTRVPPIPAITASASDTTEYPSETEMTWTAAGDDQLSVSSHLSTATYTTWPRKTSMSMWTTTATAVNSNPKEFTSREYVRTWLLTSEARAKHYYNEYGHSHGGHGVKRVHRSRTISTGAGGAVSRSRVTSSHFHPHSHGHAHSHKSLGKRHGPVGRGQSPESIEVSRPLVLTPPPKRKQHPVLPSTSDYLRHQHHRPRSDKNRSRSAKNFYKDLEIIV